MAPNLKRGLYDQQVSVCAEDIEFELRSQCYVPWADFLLNPRRLRGSDFLMRWSQGVWSEKRVIEAVDQSTGFIAYPYGPSGTAPDADPREYELYFERLEKASSEGQKRPDLLVFPFSEATVVEKVIRDLGGIEELPFTREDDPRIEDLLQRSILAVECENSLWRAKQMPDYGRILTSQRWLGGKTGLKKTAVLPTVIVKEEDREKLKSWQAEKGVPIHVWHVFYDLAFGISFDRIEELINEGLIAPTEQVFQAPGGATTRKTIYKVYHQHAYLLGEGTEEPKLVAAHIVDKNGHILPYVRFEGGKLTLDEGAKTVLRKLAEKRGRPLL